MLTSPEAAEQCKSFVRYYAVKDLKVGFMALSAFQNDEVAKRVFLTAVSDKDHPISKNCSDYEMWFIGYFFEETGNFVSEPKFLCNAINKEVI